MAAEGAGRRAGRVEQDRVEARSGCQVKRVGGDQLGGQAGALRDFRARRCETTFRSVERGHAMAGGGELHGLAAGRRAQVEHVVRHRPGSAARGARRRDPGPTSRRRRSRRDRRTAELSGRRTWRGASEVPPCVGGIGLRRGIVGEAEVERRRAGRSGGGRPATTSSPHAARPALLDRLGQARRVGWSACPGAARCRARRGPAGAGRRRPAAARWRPAHGRACRGRFSGRARGAAPSAPWYRRAAGAGSRRRSARRGRAGGAAPRRRWRWPGRGRAARGRARPPPRHRACGPGAAPHRASAARRGARRARPVRPQGLAWAVPRRILH